MCVSGRREKSSSHFPLAVRWKDLIHTGEEKSIPRCRMCIRRGNGLQTVRRGDPCSLGQPFPQQKRARMFHCGSESG